MIQKKKKKSQKLPEENARNHPNFSLVTVDSEDNKPMLKEEKKKKKHFEPIILYPGKLAMHFESKIKIFSDIQGPTLCIILSV